MMPDLFGCCAFRDQSSFHSAINCWNIQHIITPESCSMHQINQCTGVAARSQSMHDESTSIRTDESGEDTGHFSDEDGDWYGKCTFPVVGVGGIGTRIVDQLWALGLTTSLRIAIDTDRENLEEVRADRRILIGRSLSEKYEVNTLIGRMAAERHEPPSSDFLKWHLANPSVMRSHPGCLE